MIEKLLMIEPVQTRTKTDETFILCNNKHKNNCWRRKRGDRDHERLDSCYKGLKVDAVPIDMISSEIYDLNLLHAGHDKLSLICMIITRSLYTKPYSDTVTKSVTFMTIKLFDTRSLLLEVNPVAWGNINTRSQFEGWDKTSYTA
ncbi:hypothetical protein RF11_11094 [Thelohanellus kitauei]|uniref:Uncharacterized protein n=1 Tax=Thelohanellus kitauei TaxID=669202 RepID=A0A0C2JJ83_THEKT|nr:hypothetical protein RF11_11094 [Thelohanellus kitauei]